MTSTFGGAFDRLDRELQRSILKRLTLRRTRYMRAMNMETRSTEVILLGDTPGPGRPTATGYHHTPFYSTKNSSLWINKLLSDHGVPETSLLWYNTTLADGSPLDRNLINIQLKHNPQAVVICLGGNAEKWFKKNFQGVEYHKVFHPQAWKRFHSKEPYPLLGHLQQMLDL